MIGIEKCRNLSRSFDPSLIDKTFLLLYYIPTSHKGLVGDIMASKDNRKESLLLEENLKKALTELLLLHLLNQREYYIIELTTALFQQSGGVLNIVFPYSAVYRLQQSGYIMESEKRHAPDGRRRQFLRITDQGRIYYQQLFDTYCSFSQGITAVLTEGEHTND